MTTSVKSLDPTVKVSWSYLVPFGGVWFGSGVTPKLTRGPQTRIRPRRLSLLEFPSLAQNFRPVELTQAEPEAEERSSLGGRRKIALIFLMCSATCSDWESWTKSLCTVWLVSTWERRLITWLRSSRHCWCRLAWHPETASVISPPTAVDS